MYQQAIAAGLDPNQAKQFAEIAASTSVVAAPLIVLLISIVVFFIVGIIMALLWNRVKPWYALGLLFGIILVLIDVMLQMPIDAPQVELQELPPPPELPAVYTVIPLLLWFTGPVLLAWFLSRKIR